MYVNGMIVLRFVNVFLMSPYHMSKKSCFNYISHIIMKYQEAPYWEVSLDPYSGTIECVWLRIRQSINQFYETVFYHLLI